MMILKEVLTEENYYSATANLAYMSVSQYKAFSKCEAAALAEIRGEYIRPTTKAMLVGGYVDAHFSGTMEMFCTEHPEICKKDGTLKAEFIEADILISRLEQDELFNLLMGGEKQVIKTGTISGVPFKVKIDSLLSEAQVEQIVRRFPETAMALGFPFSAGAIVDMKIMKDLSPVWSDDLHQRIPFAQYYGYDIQGAIYREVDGRELPFVLDVGTKETEPDISAMYIPSDDLTAKLIEIEDNAPRYQAIKQGKEEPHRCEHCDYCKRTRRLHTIVDYRGARYGV
jgi:hypothetical protein